MAGRKTELGIVRIALGEATLEAKQQHAGHAAAVLGTLGHLHAMRGEFELARRLVLQALATRDEGSIEVDASAAEVRSRIRIRRSSGAARPPALRWV